MYDDVGAGAERCPCCGIRLAGMEADAAEGVDIDKVVGGDYCIDIVGDGCDTQFAVGEQCGTVELIPHAAVIHFHDEVARV